MRRRRASRKRWSSTCAPGPYTCRSRAARPIRHWSSARRWQAAHRPGGDPRGVPAAYGGFETAVEEVGKRLAARGHEVTVYCRGEAVHGDEYLGMKLVHLPAMHSKSLETLSHTGASVAHLVAHRRPDVAVVFNAANRPLWRGCAASPWPRTWTA